MPANAEILNGLLGVTPLARLDVAVIATLWDGSIGFWNKAAEETYGWSATEVIGLNVAEVTPARMATAQATEIMDSLRRGEVWEGEFPVRRRDGREFAAFVMDTPLPARAGLPGAIIGASAPVAQAQKVRQRNVLLLNELNERLSDVWSVRPSGDDVSMAYYRCYLVDGRGRFGGMRDGLFSGDEEAAAFAREELRKARLTFSFTRVEVWRGEQLVVLLDA